MLQETVLAAAKPPPAEHPLEPKKKQLSIAPFFRPRNNPE